MPVLRINSIDFMIHDWTRHSTCSPFYLVELSKTNTCCTCSYVSATHTCIIVTCSSQCLTCTHQQSVVVRLLFCMARISFLDLRSTLCMHRSYMVLRPPCKRQLLNANIRAKTHEHFSEKMVLNIIMSRWSCKN